MMEFLGSKEDYLSTTYIGCFGDFTTKQHLVYPKNSWILDLFNETNTYQRNYGARGYLERLENNPKDWTLIKHVIYRKFKKIWLQGQIALFSPKLGLKFFFYQYSIKTEPPDICDMIFFQEIPHNKFKTKLP